MNILLGITGSIAAYKSLIILSELLKAGHAVRVVLSKSACTFVTPLSVEALGAEAVLAGDLLPTPMLHIAWARWADAILLAPATANTLTKFALGIADSPLLELLLAASVPIGVAPAMNQQMWQAAITQQHYQTLLNRQVGIIGPDTGLQACGEVGPGRLTEPDVIVREFLAFINTTKPLQGKSILITAGPTREWTDPIRYISNASSGKMGYALAHAALALGACVILVSGSCALSKPIGANFIPVITAKQMHDAVFQALENDTVDAFFSVAAVADFTPTHLADKKLPKLAMEKEIQLSPTLDILAAVADSIKRPKLVVGFAAQTDNTVAYAKAKLEAKNIDYILANTVGLNLGMESDDNALDLIGKNLHIHFPRQLKSELATTILNYFNEVLHKF